MKKFSPKEKVYLVVERRKVKIPIVSKLPNKFKIHSLTIMSCISLDVSVSIE